MKNLRLLPFIIALIAFIGCDLIDQIKDASTIDVEAEVIREIPVNIGEDDEDKLVEESFTILASDNQDIADYLADINSFTVRKVFLEVTQYSGDPDITFTGSISLENGTVIIPLTSVKPSMYTNSNYLQLTLTAAQLQILNIALTENWAINGLVSGTVSDKPVSFIIVIWVEVVAEAEV